MKGAEAAKKEGIGFDKEFEQTAALGDAPVVEKGLSTGEKIAAGAGTTGTANWCINLENQSREQQKQLLQNF